MLLLPIVFLLNSFYYICVLKSNRKNIPLTLYYHLYFMLNATFIWRGEKLINNFCFYFLSDLLLQLLNKSLNAFTLFHHIFGLTAIYNSNHICPLILNLSALQEFSTILLNLRDLNLISRKNFRKIFPISFILCRLVIPNYYIIFNNSCETYNNTTLIIISIFNIMNICIVYVLDLFSIKKYTEIFIHQYLFTTKICFLSTLLFLIPVRLAYLMKKNDIAFLYFLITMISLNHWRDFQTGSLRQLIDRIVANISFIYALYESITGKPTLFPYMILSFSIFMFSNILKYVFKLHYWFYFHVIFHFSVVNIMFVYINE